MKSKVQRWGNSLAVRIPKSFALESHMAEGSVVDISIRDGEIVVAPVAETTYTLAQLVAGITDKNRHPETDHGPSVGNEAW